MTREKEIEQAMKESVAETIYASGWGMTPQATDLLGCAFTKGAEWADKNPKDGMVSLEKVEKWLMAADIKYYMSRDEYSGCLNINMPKLIKDFHKAMRE